MKLKIFTLEFSDSSGGFDDEPIQAFIADKEVVEYSEHFFVHQKTPFLLLIISYRSVAPEERQKSRRQDSPLPELDKNEKHAYNALRTWRAARSKQEGIPPYLIATNRQLVKMIKLKVSSKAGLAEVSGIGEKKIEQYGEEIIKILAEHLLGERSQPDLSRKEVRE